jgi:hypothetical protein
LELAILPRLKPNRSWKKRLWAIFALLGRGSAKGFQGERASQAVMPTSPAS